MEMLSEHTLSQHGSKVTCSQAAHGFFSTYEAFVHVIHLMFNQHAKGTEIKKGTGAGAFRRRP